MALFNLNNYTYGKNLYKSPLTQFLFIINLLNSYNGFQSISRSSGDNQCDFL